MRFSVEAFPPRSEKNRTGLQQAVNKISLIGTEFLSITCGAGGGDNDDLTSVVDMAISAGVPFVPHITMSNVSREKLMSMIHKYEAMGATGFVALRGDAPAHQDGFEDVRGLISEIASRSGSKVFCAGYPDPHPDSISDDLDIKWIKGKAEAGADEIITQYTFSIETLCRFRDKVAKIVPRIGLRPGVMLIKDLNGVLSFSKRSGVPVPESLIYRLEGREGEDLINISSDLTAGFIREMAAEGFGSFHAYALNDHRILSRLDDMEVLTASRKAGMMSL